MLGHNVAFVVLLNAIQLVRSADTVVYPLVVTVTAKLRDRDKITWGETLPPRGHYMSRDIGINGEPDCCCLMSHRG